MIQRIKIGLLVGIVCAISGWCLTVDAKAAPDYKVDKEFKGDLKAGIRYISITPKDELCCLLSDGKVIVIDSEGKELKNFKVEAKGSPTAIAVDDKGNIYVLTTQMELKEFKRKGKTYKRQMPVGVSLSKYDKDGKSLDTKVIEGVRAAKSAQIVKDKIIIADNTQNTLFICDIKTCKVKKKVNKGIRTCCGIFDFCKDSKGTLWVANLGGFKVQGFKSTGSSSKSFGKRGKELSDFHGCCNPVSVSVLSDGSFVTAEKSPTRVKVYDSTGKNAKKIEGIEELVKGCTHIPMASDSKGNVYLASNKGKIIKCIQQ